MDKKTYTFLIASNRHGATRRIKISAAWVRTIIAFSIISIVILSATLIDYSGLLVSSNEAKRLRAENTQLKSQFKVVEGKLNALESGLERVKSFSTKLKLLTKSMGTKDQELRLAMGPLVRTGQAIEHLHEPMTKREMADEVGDQDRVFLEKPPLDFSRGELSVEGQRDYASLSVRIDQSLKGVNLQEQGIMELWGTLREKQSRLASTPSIRPVGGWFTSRFGYRVSPFTGRPAMHAGLDIAAASGSAVKAPADGIVSYSGFDEGYGKLISIDHGWGVVTRYGHNSKLFVKVGQKVKRGDVISLVGNTGRSTGPHLHYEVRLNSIPVDPANFILDE